MNAHGIDIAKLRKGDVISVREHGTDIFSREVVAVIDTDGARGGIVDTKPINGGYSRTAGYVLGDTIVAVEAAAK
jgi:hypothetical protein